MTRKALGVILTSQCNNFQITRPNNCMNQCIDLNYWKFFYWIICLVLPVVQALLIWKGGLQLEH